ncbi:MAG: hypothetical protein LBU88_09820 [Treponema sp.]|jgi:hypothetical protein|nr:hypothetical protein [Treponema sp.]
MKNLRFIAAFFIFGLVSQTFVWGQQWRDITSNSQLVGKWEGSVDMPMPSFDDFGISNFSMKITFFMELPRGSDKITMAVKMDMGKFLDVLAISPELGGMFTKDQLWELITMEAANSPEYTIGNDYSITVDISESIDDFLSDDVKIQIDTRGNRIKLIFTEPWALDFVDNEINEVILNKR